jgi:zinc/manganese transport system substrate-binding protein
MRSVQMRFILMLIVAAALLGGCASQSGSNGGLPVTATTTQVADIVRAVGGDRVDVTQILHPNADPHEYEPRPSDAIALRNARLVFRSGGDVDDWLSGVVREAGKGTDVITLSDSLTTLPGDGGKGIDPHWWQDPRNGEAAVRKIRDELVRVDPAGRSVYNRRAAAYLRRLARLDASIARCIQRVPAAERELVTSHDAFGYYTRRYGIKLVGTAIPSRSTQAQPSAASVTKLIALIQRDHVKAIFPETSVSPKLEQAISREAGARLGRPLWGDALGPSGSSGATYIDSLSSNTAAFVDGFTGGRVACRPSARN